MYFMILKALEQVDSFQKVKFEQNSTISETPCKVKSIAFEQSQKISPTIAIMYDVPGQKVDEITYIDDEEDECLDFIQRYLCP